MQKDGAVNFDAGLVKQQPADEMKAINAQPEQPVETLTKPEGCCGGCQQEAAVEEYPVDALNTLDLVFMLSLNLADDRVKGLDDLKNVEIGEGESAVSYNLYNPFAKAKAESQLGVGVLRNTFSNIIKMSEDIQGREVVYLGSVDQARQVAKNIAAKLAYDIECDLPLPYNTELISVEEESNAYKVCFKDLFEVRTWVTTDIDSSSAVNTTMYVNLIVNAPAFYDTGEPHIFVERATSFINHIVEKNLGGKPGFGVYLNVQLQTSSIADPAIREFIGILVDDEGFNVVSALDVIRGNEEWIESENANQLFGTGSDLILMSQELFTEEEEADGDDVEEDDSEE